MSSSRSVNWISALLAAAYVVIYLVAPFYQMALLPLSLNGIRLIGFNAFAILPVLLGTVMAIGACLFPPVAAFITEGITLLTTFALMLLGNTFVTSLAISSLNLSTDWAIPIEGVVTASATIVPGWGAIVCMVLGIAALVVDIIAKRPAPPPDRESDPIDIDNNENGPFGPRLF